MKLNFFFVLLLAHLCSRVPKRTTRIWDKVSQARVGYHENENKRFDDRIVHGKNLRNDKKSKKLERKIMNFAIKSVVCVSGNISRAGSTFS